MGYVGQAPATKLATSADIKDLVIRNADINSSAAIAYSKLAALSDGNILVGNGSNVAASVNPSGDVDVSNAGVFSIASDSVVNADVKSDAAIAISKLATITLATNTSGDYVQNITAGTGLTSTGATSGENIAHSLSVDASQTGITSVGDLDAGSITSNFGNIDTGSSTITTTGSLQIQTIDYTDGDLAMTIADGGGVTFAQASTFTGGLTLNGDANLAAEKLIKIGGTAEAHDFSTEHSGHGITLTMEAGETLTLGQAVYVDANGKAQHPDVDASGVTGKPAIGIAMTGASSGTSVNVMVLGIFRDTTYNFSPGAAVIMTGTDGALTTTAGDTAADGDIVQRVGIAITADMLFVMPSIDEIEHA
jgi:hypothetical protein